MLALKAKVSAPKVVDAAEAAAKAAAKIAKVMK
jgi:hypothetical protein